MMMEVLDGKRGFWKEREKRTSPVDSQPRSRPLSIHPKFRKESSQTVKDDKEEARKDEKEEREKE